MNIKKRYIFSFIITVGIFLTAFLTSTYISNQRVEIIENTADKISVDILSLETQFELFEETSCESLRNSVLSNEIRNLGQRLEFAESERGVHDEDVISLKKYYSLLQIKEYLLIKKIDGRCKGRSIESDLSNSDTNSTSTPIALLYFYTNNECEKCVQQGYVLTELSNLEPRLKIYSFDYDLNLGAIKTLINIHDIKPDLPAIVINDKVYQGLQTLEQMTDIDDLKHLKDLISKPLFDDIDDKRQVGEVL